AELNIGAIVNPNNMPKLKATMAEELKRLIDNGVSLEELDHAKASWLDQQSVSRSQDNALATVLARDLYAGRTIAYEAELEKKIKALTPDQVSDVARKYLDPNHLVIITAGDFGT